jgi:hypothetical protein
VSRRDEQRHERRRQEQQHRHEDELGRHAVARADGELDPGGDDVRREERDGEQDVELPRGRREDGERGRGDHEPAGEQPVGEPLAAVGRAGLALERLAEPALGSSVEVRGLGAGHGGSDLRRPAEYHQICPRLGMLRAVE